MLTGKKRANQKKSRPLYRGTSTEKLNQNLQNGQYASETVHFSEKQKYALNFADDILLEYQETQSPDTRRKVIDGKTRQEEWMIENPDLDEITVYHLNQQKETPSLFRIRENNEIRQVRYETETLQDYYEREILNQ